MIAIVSSHSSERTAIAALCDNRDWAVAACDSVRQFRRLLMQKPLRVILTRDRLSDGFSDDVIAAARAGNTPEPRIIVILPAGTPSGIEARQVTLGADCVLRDPVRSNVLVEYLAKFVNASTASIRARGIAPREFSLAGARVDAASRRLHGPRGIVSLTPRELTLAQLLVDATDEVITYEVLYQEVLGRRFSGDTSNMRVLLGKLGASAQKAGMDLRERVEVIPKTGYRYRGN